MNKQRRKDLNSVLSSLDGLEKVDSLTDAKDIIESAYNDVQTAAEDEEYSLDCMPDSLSYSYRADCIRDNIENLRDAECELECILGDLEESGGFVYDAFSKQLVEVYKNIAKAINR